MPTPPYQIPKSPKTSSRDPRRRKTSYPSSTSSKRSSVSIQDAFGNPVTETFFRDNYLGGETWNPCSTGCADATRL